MKKALFTAFLISLFTIAQSQIVDSTTTHFKLNNDTLKIVHYNSLSKDSILLIHLHHNEQTALNTAFDFINQSPKYSFIYLINHFNREVNFKLAKYQVSFDPNRIFTKKGISKTVKTHISQYHHAIKTVDNLSQFLINQYLVKANLIIALHNNTPLGPLTVNDFKLEGKYANEALNVFVNDLNEIDNFVITTSLDIYIYLKEQNINVVLQHPHPMDDGSLSVWAAQNNKTYINIEVEHGNLLRQQEILRIIKNWIDKKETGKND